MTKKEIAEFILSIDANFNLSEAERFTKLVELFYELQQENKQLKNIIDELEKWLEEYHKYQNKLKWNEKDYKNFIANLEKELKGSDSNE